MGKIETKSIYKTDKKPASGEEITETLINRRSIKVERIISNRASTGWYDQDENEFVLLLKGGAVLDFDGETVEMKEGDWILIKAHQKHRVVSTEKDTVWLCVFFRDEI